MIGLSLAPAFLATVVSLFFTVYFIKFRRFRKFMKQLPGPNKLPFVGNALQLNLSNEETTQLVQFKWAKMFAPRFTLQLGPRYYFITNQPKDIEKVLSSSTHIHKGTEYKFIHNWLGEGLLTSSGSKWFKRRKQLTPSFHFKILEQFMSVFNRQSRVFVDVLREESANGKVIEASEYVTRCTLDIICETAMGKPMNAQREKDTPYVTAIYKYITSMLKDYVSPLWTFIRLSNILNDRSVNPLLQSEFAWRLTSKGRQEKEYLKILHGFTDSVIKERKAEMIKLRSEGGNDETSVEDDLFLSGKKRAVAFMDLLVSAQLDDPKAISDKEIREETDTFMFEGHDTTAASLSWTIYMFGCYPEHQEKVIEELHSVFGDDKERPITTQDLTRMKYLECCIKESLRLYPSVPFMSRELVEDLELDDLTVPKGFNFVIFPMVIHQNPEAFPEPTEFKPERFFPENSSGRHPYAYVPFSAGPRNCIGQKFALMEEKVVLANLLRNFRVEATEKREDIVIMTEIILRSKNGLNVKLHPR